MNLLQILQSKLLMFIVRKAAALLSGLNDDRNSLRLDKIVTRLAFWSRK